MFFSIQELELRKITFSEVFEPGSVDYNDPKLKQATGLRVEGWAEWSASTQEIRVNGSLKVEMGAECDRCLEPASFPVEGRFRLAYRPSQSPMQGHETLLDAAEAEIGFFEGDGLELADVVREHVLLSLPMQRLCRPECKGICPRCGQNRNDAECACATVKIDERWEALKQIKV